MTGVSRLPLRVIALPGGGCQLEGSDGETVRFEPDGAGWASGADAPGARLERAGDGGLVLRDRAGNELGRTTSISGRASEANLYYLLTGDGCLYRIRLRHPPDGGFELSGWETKGAYLVATRDSPQGWRLAPEPAGAGMQDGSLLGVLFAAQILDSEDDLDGEAADQDAAV